jgi:bacillithiol synthase
MAPRTISYTDLPGTSRLFLDYLYEPAKTREFYAPPHWEPVDYPTDRRAALVAALRVQNGDHPSLELLARPGTVVVATGQQVGLFTGPAYTIYKALTAAKLARRLTEQGLPAVPVFWLATEDHDFDEVNHCWVFDDACQPVRIEAGHAAAPHTPVGPIPISDGVTSDLRRALDGLPFAGQVADLVEDAYTAGSTFGASFQRLLGKLLAPYGLLYLDPLEPSARQLAAPILAQALERSADLVRLVLERNRALAAAGYHAQVHVDPESSLLFLLEGGRRLPLRAGPGGLRAEDLSPNALLRPVVQDFMMPTVASVMGPAEVAYMAQAQVIYRELLGRLPVVVPRAAFTILDARSYRLLARYSLSLGDFFQGEEALRERAARAMTPPELATNIQQLTEATDAGIARMRAELLRFDPTLAEALERSRHKVLYQLGKIGGKVSREALRRSERVDAGTARLVGLMYPHRRLQERFYSILPLLAQHGVDLIETVYRNIDLDSRDHRVLTIEA